MRDTGYWMLDAGCERIAIDPVIPNPLNLMWFDPSVLAGHLPCSCMLKVDTRLLPFGNKTPMLVGEEVPVLGHEPVPEFLPPASTKIGE